MRFGSRSVVLSACIAVLLPVAALSISPSIAKEGPSPLSQSTPRLDMNWSEVRKPKVASLKKLRAHLDVGDAFATLNAFHVALSTIGDGQTYVWGRPKRQLRAMITPTRSFRNSDRQLCRLLVVTLALGSHIKRAETVACRADDKSWQMMG